MAKLDKISGKVAKIAEAALVLEPQLNYSRQYQFHLEFIRNNSEVLPDEVPDGTYFYDIPAVLPLFRSIFQVCSCQVGNIVDLKDFEGYLKEVEALVGEMEKESDKVLFSRPVQED